MTRQQPDAEPQDDEVFIGEEGPSFTWVVEAGKAKEFGVACLDDDGASGDFVPVTFPHVASHFWEPDAGRAGIATPFELARLLHGEQEYEFTRPLRIGDVLSGRTRLANYYVKEGKRGGKMRFAVYETTYQDSDGGLVARCQSTLIEVAKPRE
jgi:hypothetical protein